MAAFHVFVEGATDDSPAGLSRLADAIAKHYGLPAADLLARLQKGRFRVKGNIDRATAETYVRDLQRLGARCAIDEATAANSQRATPIPFPAVRPATPPAGTPVTSTPVTSTPVTSTPVTSTPVTSTPVTSTPVTSTPPPAVARTSTTPPLGGAQFQSGLSAAFSGDAAAADLGALGRDEAAFSLSTVDGADEPGAAPGGAVAPPGGLPASIGPAPDKPKPAVKARAAKPKDEPVDLFAPPELQGEQFKVDIAADDRDVAERKNATTTPPVAGEAAAQPAAAAPPVRKSQPSLQPPNAPVAMVVPSKFGPLGEPRVRFAAGVILAVLLGFAPAHFIAKLREDSAYETVDRRVIAAQQQAETPELYAALDRLRAEQLARKESEQRNAAIIGFAIWALVGAGVAFAWFKKIPWE